MIVDVFLNRAHSTNSRPCVVYCGRPGQASMLHLHKNAGIEPTDLDLSPSPRADYQEIKMEEDVRSALLSRYYKESKFDSPIIVSIIQFLSY